VRRLYDVSRRNNLLFFRDLTRGTLDFTAAEGSMLSALLKGESVSFARLLPDADAAKLGMSVQEIRRRALANVEEKGLHTLYLALGLATWTPDDEGRAAAAAVVLAPVAIERHGRDGRGFAIARAGEMQVNPVLLHVLANEFGCRIDEEELLAAPDEEKAFDPAAVFFRLLKAAREVPGFSVAPRSVLGNFAFQKMAMVQDLQERVDELAAHDLIAALAGDGPAREAIRLNRAAIDPAALDLVSPDDEFLVFDADSSQQRVIAAVLAGQSGVIQGPPGTGKSQTIANLIAALVAAGKRVLFVAEKRAALDVVLQRLDRAGLGRLALDLHGADISRQQVMRRLAESLALVRDSTPAEYQELHKRFTERRRRLNEHAERLNAPRTPSGLSAFGMLGRLLGVPAEEQGKTRWRGGQLAALDAKAAERIRELLTEAGGFGDLFSRADPSPWTRAELPDGAAVGRALELVGGLLHERLPALRAALTELPGLRAPATLDEARNLAALLDDIAETQRQYRPELFAEDLPALAAALAPAARNALGRGMMWLANGAYRGACRAALAHRRDKAPPPALLREMTAAADQLHRWRTHADGPVPADVAARQQIGAAVAELAALEPLLPAHGLFGLSLDEVERLLADLRADEQTPYRIPRLREIERELAGLGIAPLLEEIRADRPAPARWPRLFDYAWLASCLDAARYAEPALGGFNGRAHERFVEEFCELDRQRLLSAAARVRRAHAEHAIAVMNRFPDQQALVRREAEKKTRHLPLRALLAQAPDVLTALCPCWMASPLSVSQLLGADRRYFDVVIFDEASQVLPEDAVPALLRASQAVVAGDKHQLPPTIFFMPGEADEPAEEAAPTEGFESLLDLLSAFLEPWSLEWHYRSRDEALIAFSNHHIYDDRLVTFPGVGKSVAVSHVSIGKAEGEDTDSSVAEVRRVVELVLEHARTRPHETLGVIALGIKHAARVQDALDDALDEHPELDEFFSEARTERFFVKNLERVQGDERDAIILSVGYAKDKSGKLPYRFGPLLTAGGERRLNVAITRARVRLTLVSSFNHHDMDPDRSTARGVELLRGYLEYAAHNGLSLRDRQSAEAEDPFLADVAAALAEQGIPVRTHWGTSRYRLECAAPHPERPERLVLAVETDGDSYVSAPTARDRDRLRREQLQRLGWRFTRLWAVDWQMRRDEELARLTAAYRDAAAQADRDDAGDGEEAAPVTAPGAESGASPVGTSSLPARGLKPRLTRHDGIADYPRSDLVRLLRWLHSDCRLRTDEEILDEMTAELGFKRLGPKAEEALRAAIADWKRIEKLV
jgi:very-short-patch-repair endonuclease